MDTSTKRKGSPGVSSRYQWLEKPNALEALRQGFRQMNRGMVLLWRLGLGRFAEMWPRGFGRVLVIEHIGRKSGTRYLSPVNFTRFGGDLYCVAAFGPRTDWYRNALEQPQTAVWLPDGRWEVRFEDVSDHPERLELMRNVLLDAGFAAPLFGLHPGRMSDDELADATESYMLVRIRPERPQRADGGPDDLVWVWVPVGLAVSGVVLWRKVRARTPAT